jgi:hypothetical protein
VVRANVSRECQLFLVPYRWTLESTLDEILVYIAIYFRWLCPDIAMGWHIAHPHPEHASQQKLSGLGDSLDPDDRFQTERGF